MEIKEKFKVDGMMCASCQVHVEQAIKKEKGVKKVEVSLLDNSMVVDYDDKVITKQNIINNVKKAGYKASIYEDINFDLKQKKDLKALKKTKNKLIISLILLALLMILSMGNMLLTHFDSPIKIDNPILLISLELILLIPIMILNISHYTNGFKALFSLHPNMDSLIALGSLASFIYGIVVFIIIIVFTINKQDYSMYLNKIYLESSGTIVTLVSLGKYFEKKATNKTTTAINSLMKLKPSTVNILINDKEKNILIDELKVNDIVIIKPGELIPADGIIINGYANINEATITGESIPVYKTINDKVLSGTINTLGSFAFKVSVIGKDSTLNKIISLVEEAANSKAPMARIADKVSGIFVPIVILISIFSFVIWLIISNYNFETAFNFSITVLVISCPCALGLATPVAIMVGTGKAAENGLLIKSAEAFEKMYKVKTIVLDKTGTITTGEMSIDQIFGDTSILTKIKAIEKLSEHPLSKAISKNESILDSNFNIENFIYEPGYGVKASIDKDNFIIGNIDLMKDNKVSINKEILTQYEKLIKDGKTVVFCSINNQSNTIISISDTIKKDSINAIKKLKELKIKIVLLSGDNKEVASYVAKLLNIDEFYANIKPDGKQQIIKQIKNNNEIIAMVGDGINDAPSLKAADIGIAIGAGSDVAIDSADIILVRSSLMDVYNAINLSKKVVNTIKTNLFWAFIYNVIGIPLSAGVLYFAPLYIELNPMIASLFMSLSSITVVLNALRIKLFKIEKGE